MAHRHTEGKGFTLVELLVVIGIIVVLLAILLPVISAAREKARQTNCISNLHSIAMAAKIFYQDNRSYPNEPILDAQGVWQGGVSELYPDYLDSVKSLACPRDRALTSKFKPEQRYSSYNWFDANGDEQIDSSTDAMTFNRWGFFEAPDPGDTGMGTPGVVDDPNGLPYGCIGGWNQNLVQVWNNNPAIKTAAKYPALANPSAPGNTIICVCRHHESIHKGPSRVELIVRVGGEAKAVKLGNVDFISQGEF
jgi:prepilin-type N-terminal cleavage/methylation domain-containing protein